MNPKLISNNLFLKISQSMTRRRGAYCADDTEEYIKLAIDNENKVSPFYDDVKGPTLQKLNFSNFEFDQGRKQAPSEETSDNPFERTFKVLLLDTNKELKAQTQQFCCRERTLGQDDYITDFYSKEAQPRCQLQLWLQNYRSTQYQSLKDLYLKTFSHYVIVETRRNRRQTRDIISKILDHNPTAKTIYKLKVGPTRKPLPQTGVVQLVCCSSLSDGLSQVESLIFN